MAVTVNDFFVSMEKSCLIIFLTYHVLVLFSHGCGIFYSLPIIDSSKVVISCWRNRMCT